MTGRQLAPASIIRASETPAPATPRPPRRARRPPAPARGGRGHEQQALGEPARPADGQGEQGSSRCSVSSSRSGELEAREEAEGEQEVLEGEAEVAGRRRRRGPELLGVPARSARARTTTLSEMTPMISANTPTPTSQAEQAAPLRPQRERGGRGEQVQAGPRRCRGRRAGRPMSRRRSIPRRASSEERAWPAPAGSAPPAGRRRTAQLLGPAQRRRPAQPAGRRVSATIRRSSATASTAPAIPGLRRVGAIWLGSAPTPTNTGSGDRARVDRKTDARSPHGREDPASSASQTIAAPTRSPASAARNTPARSPPRRGRARDGRRPPRRAARARPRAAPQPPRRSQKDPPAATTCSRRR